MERIWPIGLSIALTLIATHAYALDTDDFERINRQVEDTKRLIDYPFGTAFAVIKGDRIIYQGFSGYEDIAAKKPVDEETLFYIASSTKSFFALATLLKEGEGHLNETSTLRDLFPDLAFEKISPADITVKHLLVHTSGIENEPLVWATAYTGSHDYAFRRELVDQSTPRSEGGIDRFAYGNIGYNILSVWFDEYYKRSWKETLRETVLDPLELERTSAYMSEAAKNNWPVAKPYSILQKRTPLSLSKQDNTMHAAGGMISTTSDLGRLVIAQLNEGRVDGEQVFPAAIIRKSHRVEAKQDRSFDNIKRTGYAWGYNVGEYQGQTLYHHFGSFSGSSAHVSFMPEKGIGLVVLNNNLEIGIPLMNRISDAVYGVLLESGDLDARLTGLNDSLVQLTNKLDERMAAVAERMNARQWDLSMEKPAYTGIYKNPLYGEIKVERDNADRLFMEWGNLRSIATPGSKPETVRVEWTKGSGSNVKFLIEDGRVAALRTKRETFSKK